MDHVIKTPRPSPSVIAYCKQSTTGGVQGLGMRLSWYWNEHSEAQKKEHLFNRHHLITQVVGYGYMSGACCTIPNLID